MKKLEVLEGGGGEPSAVRAEVNYVRATGGDGETDLHGWVECPRRLHVMALQYCESCVQRVDTEYGESHGECRARALLCRPPAEAVEQAPRHALLPVVRLGQVMTRNVLCVRPDLSLDSLMNLFVERSFRGVPVVDAEGTLVGMVSEADLLADAQALAGSGDGGAAVAETEGLRASSPVRTVGDVMSPLAFELYESAPITQAAALMAFEGVSRIVVRGVDGRVVGLVTATDVLFWLARSDGYSMGPPRRMD